MSGEHPDSALNRALAESLLSYGIKCADEQYGIAHEFIGAHRQDRDFASQLSRHLLHSLHEGAVSLMMRAGYSRTFRRP